MKLSQMVRCESSSGGRGRRTGGRRAGGRVAGAEGFGEGGF